MAESYLIEFYGRECPPCIRMKPVVERLEKELGIKFERLEVWHDRENARKMMEFEEELMEACGGGLGVPAFFNKRTGKGLCGAVSYEELKEWATEEPFTQSGIA